MDDMAQQQCGTRSTFGPQALSNRASSPVIKFGSGGRTTKTWERAWESALLCRTSPGATTTVRSGIGCQAESRCKSAPAHKTLKAALHNKPSSPNIGPGTYKTPTDTLGLQLVESQRPRSAAYKLGTSPRWCELQKGLTGGAAQPMLVNTKLPVGYLGDAPAWSFHGPQQRQPLTAGSSQSLSCPLAPSSASAPGPGAYATACSAFGRQVPSSAASSPAASVPRAQRDKLLRQALPRGQEHVLKGNASPGPCFPQTSSLGRQVSRARSSTGMKFGSSDRFSDTKPSLKKTSSSTSSTNGGSSLSGSGTARSLSGAGQRPGSAGEAGVATAWPFSSPGPGAYVV